MHHSLCFASARKSTKRWLFNPKSPMPNLPGKEVRCNRIPLPRPMITKYPQGLSHFADFPILFQCRNLDVRAQHLGHAPCLCNTAAVRIGRFGVKNLPDGADGVSRQSFVKRT